MGYDQRVEVAKRRRDELFKAIENKDKRKIVKEEELSKSVDEFYTMNQKDIEIIKSF